MYPHQSRATCPRSVPLSRRSAPNARVTRAQIRLLADGLSRLPARADMFEGIDWTDGVESHHGLSHD